MFKNIFKKQSDKTTPSKDNMEKLNEEILKISIQNWEQLQNTRKQLEEAQETIHNQRQYMAANTPKMPIYWNTDELYGANMQGGDE